MPTLFKLRSFLTLLSAGLILFAFSSCRSYNLGHPGELAFESIYIAPVKNDSYAPQAQALVSSDIREAFIRDARVKVVTSEEAADVVLEVTLTEYKRSPGARSNVDTVQAFDFDITLESKVGLYDPISGKYLFENERIEARTNAYTENPYAGAGALNTQTYHIAERQALPNLSRSMAQRIADRVLSAW